MIRYTTEDINRLRSILLRVYRDVDTGLHIPLAYVYPAGLAHTHLDSPPQLNSHGHLTPESDPQAFLAYYVCNTVDKNSEYAKFYMNKVTYDMKTIRDLIFRVPCEEVPLYMHDENLLPYVEWRLEIGK